MNLHAAWVRCLINTETSDYSAAEEKGGQRLPYIMHGNLDLLCSSVVCILLQCSYKLMPLWSHALANTFDVNTLPFPLPPLCIILMLMLILWTAQASNALQRELQSSFCINEQAYSPRFTRQQHIWEHVATDYHWWPSKQPMTQTLLILHLLELISLIDECSLDGYNTVVWSLLFPRFYYLCLNVRLSDTWLFKHNETPNRLQKPLRILFLFGGMNYQPPAEPQHPSQPSKHTCCAFFWLLVCLTN